MTRSAALLGSLALCALAACDESKPQETKPSEQVIYRFRGKDGSLHFTDDKSSIPADATVEETTGADIKVVSMPKVDAGPAKVGSESEWRARFREQNRRIAELEAAVAVDGKIAGAAETNEIIEEAMAHDEPFNAALRRLRANRKELLRQQNALKELNSAADAVNVPKEWRGD